MRDDEFVPRLGRVRDVGKGKGSRFRGQVRAVVSRLGQPGRAVGGRRFDGSRIGRGASMGRLLSSRDRHSSIRGRRVIVKTSLVRLKGKGQSPAGAHLRYIQRDGVTREGAPGQLYDRDTDDANSGAFLTRAEGDRHQFRFIVSAEDGTEYPDLKPFIRRLMTQVEQDLGTRLDWVAVDHFNTAHPHTHIMLRGVDGQGENLVISPEYIAHGLRERAVELVNIDLGPRTDQEIEARFRLDIGAERLTAIDRQLLRSADQDRIVRARDLDPFTQAVRMGRLQTLGRFGFAHEIGGGRWQLADELEGALRALGERGDIIRTMQREMTRLRTEREEADVRIHVTSEPDATPIVGKVIARGLADEHRDRHYLLIDGIDGVVHYVDIGKGEGVEPTPEGSIVRITPASMGIRDVDRTIDRIARANGGLYSIDLHLRHDGSASDAFANAHVRRLEAMRRRSKSVERLPDGSWRISENHLARAEAHERSIVRDRPVAVTLMSTSPIERLARLHAATWLDRRLIDAHADPARDTGFGHEVREAEARRRQWLVEQNLVAERDGIVRYPPDMIDQLRRRELLRIAARLSGEIGLEFTEAVDGACVSGVLRRAVEGLSGRFALIERAHDFTLVPWNAVLEQRIGKPISGIVREAGTNWTIGREHGGPSLT